MNVRRVTTENPEAEQWRLLAQYSYEPNIRRYLAARGHGSPQQTDIEYIAGSLRQSEAYYRAAQSSPLDIAPLLAYYGAVNLLSAVAAMLSGSRPAINSHGMELVKPHAPGRIADIEIKPATGNGGLPVLSKIFDPGPPLPGGVSWTMEEILGSLPDLKPEFVGCFPSARSLTLPIEAFTSQGIVVERILVADFGQGANTLATLQAVPGFTSAYLAPQSAREFIILRRKLGASAIGTYSISGRKHLQVGVMKGKKLVAPSQEVLILMGLYALGFLSRYYSEQWNPFVQRDDSGERLVIQKFLVVALRYLPNLAVNAILGERVQFVYEVERDPSSIVVANEEELKRKIREEATAVFQDMRQR